MLLSTRWEGDTNKKNIMQKQKTLLVLNVGNGWVAGGCWGLLGWLLIVSQWIIPENSLRLAPVRSCEWKKFPTLDGSDPVKNGMARPPVFSEPGMGWDRSPTWEIPRCATDADPEAYNAATIINWFINPMHAIAICVSLTIAIYHTIGL